MGVAAGWLGLIEGVSDGLASFAKMASGYYTDRLQRRKPIAIAGYLITALGTASFGLATAVILTRKHPDLNTTPREVPARTSLTKGGFDRI